MQSRENTTIEHFDPADRNRARITRRTVDEEADRRYAALGNRNTRSARTGTNSWKHVPEPGQAEARSWRYRKYHGGEYVPKYDTYFQNQADIVRPQEFLAMKMATGIRPRTRAELHNMRDQLTPAQQDQIDDLEEDYYDAVMDQQFAAREPARPYDANHANRQTGWERRNPGRDRYIDPVGNPNEQQRLALEQSARFLPAELLHMIRPDRQPQQALTDHVGFNSIPGRTIRERNAQPVPANYVHH